MFFGFVVFCFLFGEFFYGFEEVCCVVFEKFGKGFYVFCNGFVGVFFKEFIYEVY